MKNKRGPACICMRAKLFEKISTECKINTKAPTSLVIVNCLQAESII